MRMVCAPHKNRSMNTLVPTKGITQERVLQDVTIQGWTKHFNFWDRNKSVQTKFCENRFKKYPLLTGQDV